MGLGSLALDALQTIDAAAQPKEPRATPGRAGDGARDHGEARVGRLAPQVTLKQRLFIPPLFLMQRNS
jgi:hypothetical protein